MGSDESHSKILKLDRWVVKPTEGFPVDIPFIDRQAITAVCSPNRLCQGYHLHLGIPIILKTGIPLPTRFRYGIRVENSNRRPVQRGYPTLSLDGWTNKVTNSV